MKIILHTGVEKTGSTAIQSFCRANHGQLLEIGYLYPLTIGEPGHIHLTACALESEPDHPIRRLLAITEPAAFANFRDANLRSLKDEVEASGCHTLILSDEHISAYLDSIPKLVGYRSVLESFGKVEKVIIYLRRQDKFRMSLFSEAVKSGSVGGFDYLNPLAPFDRIPYQYDYLRMLDNLSAVFGRDRLVPRLFRRDCLKAADVRHDFLHVAGVPDQDFEVDDASANRGLDSRVVRALAELAIELETTRPEITGPMRRVFVDLVHNTFTGLPVEMVADVHKSFLARFGQMNEDIRASYFPERTQPLFQPVREDADNPHYGLYPDKSFRLAEIIHTVRKDQNLDSP